MSTFEERLRTILPKSYQDRYEDVEPVSMGSAPLKFDEQGRVAWGDMWDSFCDLAMAGGPPHKGRLLTPAYQDEIAAKPGLYESAVREICRGINLAANLRASQSALPGWVQVECEDSAMSAWLLRAITMENVSCHAQGELLLLPAGPEYRIEKEIKNVITVLAKTCHYWLEHMWSSQQRKIADLFADMTMHHPLIEPPFPFMGSHASTAHSPVEQLSSGLQARTGLAVVSPSYGWLGLDCRNTQLAVSVMRGLVACNILSRREDKTLFVPVNAEVDPRGERVLNTVSHLVSFYNSRTASHDETTALL